MSDISKYVSIFSYPDYTETYAAEYPNFESAVKGILSSLLHSTRDAIDDGFELYDDEYDGILKTISDIVDHDAPLASLQKLMPADGTDLRCLYASTLIRLDIKSNQFRVDTDIDNRTEYAYVYKLQHT